MDDDTRLVELLQQGLRAEGFAVDAASDGLDGLAKAAADTYDVIILDVMMPGLNGYKVCAHLRSIGDNTPILMLTAKDGEYDEAEGLETGADDYLTKPFSFVVLTARLHALIRRARPERQIVQHFGDLEIDTGGPTRSTPVMTAWGSRRAASRRVSPSPPHRSSQDGAGPWSFRNSAGEKPSSRA
ncbi:response regulator transcription factor [Streptomyces sp. NPDC088253]|uniref:response regulator transcription factor n=1 Tax=Streptomyces sp. NPDC088253 TaxID=3365846 RepID=UPI003801154F